MADILKSYKTVLGDLEEMKADITNTKTSNEEKIKQVISLINKLETVLDKLTQNFTEFLMGKVKMPEDGGIKK